jgi:hypothetical protein
MNNWKEVKLNELFQISMGSKLDFSKMTFDNPEISYVGRSAVFNGNKKLKVDLIEGVIPFEPGSITVALGGSIGSTFLQDEAFYTSQNVSVLIPLAKYNMNKYHKLFIITVLKHQFSLKFVAFGRELNRYIRNDISILLPHNDQGNIDWEYMENHVKQSIDLERERISEFLYKNVRQVPDLNEVLWKSYKISDLFDVQTGKYYQAKTEYKPGNIPLITQTASNNGVETYVDREYFDLEKGNCVIVGSIGITAFYQESDFLSDLKIYKIYSNPKKRSLMNREIGLFLATIINMEQFKYGYGRQYYSENLKDTYIQLPSVYNKVQGYYSPDWDYIINYIKYKNNVVVQDFLKSPLNS